MLGVDVGVDIENPTLPEPGDQRPGRFRGEAVVLPGASDRPGDLGRSTQAPDSDRGLHGPDRRQLAAQPDDPVQPDLVRPAGAGGQGRIADAQLGETGGPSADELVEPLVVEDVCHLVGVPGTQGRESQTRGGDGRLRADRRYHFPIAGS